MKQKNNITATIFTAVEFDRSKYNIVEQKYPFEAKIYRLYWGDLGACIKEYEEIYGTIEKTIYHNKEKNLVGIETDVEMLNKFIKEFKCTKKLPNS